MLLMSAQVSPEAYAATILSPSTLTDFNSTFMIIQKILTLMLLTLVRFWMNRYNSKQMRIYERGQKQGYLHAICEGAHQHSWLCQSHMVQLLPCALYGTLASISCELAGQHARLPDLGPAQLGVAPLFPCCLQLQTPTHIELSSIS